MVGMKDESSVDSEERQLRSLSLPSPSCLLGFHMNSWTAVTNSFAIHVSSTKRMYYVGTM